MSSVLTCVFSVSSKREPRYWWPLLFEAMRRIGFAFDNPMYFPDRRGKYYAWSLEGAPFEADGAVTFRDVWNAAYSDLGVVMIEFWPQDKEFYWLEGTVRRQNPGLTEIMLGFPAESLPDYDEANLPVEIIKHRLHRWLDGVREVSELCTPTKADITWERWGELYRVGIIDKRRATSDSGKGELFSPIFSQSRRIEHTMTGHAIMTLLDPLPIPWRGGWELVSLLE